MDGLWRSKGDYRVMHRSIHRAVLCTIDMPTNAPQTLPARVGMMPNGIASPSARPRVRPPMWIRISRIVALAVIIGVGINHVWWSVADWHLRDMNAYWDAAMRLREGAPLFPPIGNIEASEVYRYSPWFAWLWVPLTYLPRLLVNVGWSVVLLAASAAAVWPLVRRDAWVAVAFFLPVLIGISATGNAHALLIAMLVLGVERRTGPLWIAVAASLKVFPALFAVVYLARRQWWRFGATVLLTLALAAPFLLYDLSAYVTDAGGAALLYRWPILFGASVVAALGAALWLGRTRYGWLAAALAVTLALPRFFLYDITYFMVGVPAREGRSAADER